VSAPTPDAVAASLAELARAYAAQAAELATLREQVRLLRAKSDPAAGVVACPLCRGTGRRAMPKRWQRVLAALGDRWITREQAHGIPFEPMVRAGVLRTRKVNARGKLEYAAVRAEDE
jgi:hypothetical protein